MNSSLYRAFAQPAVRAFASASAAEWLRKLHPLRLQHELFSDANPVMAGVGRLSEWVKDHRNPAPNDNPFRGLQETLSGQIVTFLDAWQKARDAWMEQLFFAVYGSPVVQAIAGIDAASTEELAAQGASAGPHRGAARAYSGWRIARGHDPSAALRWHVQGCGG
jgi:hypothetical protein